MEDGRDDDFVDVTQSVFIPECEEALKPYVGRIFATLKDGEKFYKDYGGLCGFDTRLGTTKQHSDRTILRRYVLCNREGEKYHYYDNVQKARMKRRRTSNRSNCKARVIFKFVAGGVYVVDKFIEGHSHPLVSSNHKQFMKYSRSMSSVHENWVLMGVKANIGPKKSFRMLKELVESYVNVGCDATDFKNFHHDLRAFVDGADAQMLLDKLKSSRESTSGFFFDFVTSDDEKLQRIFWADEISIANFKIFGDSISVDATYSTNRYGMIFVPFTGKDNHGKCITSASLLSSEDVESYSWVLTTFKSCMGSSPRLMITDQDPALKIAVERVMPENRHRFCMWHIMIKVADKVPLHLRKSTNFTDRLNAIVWTNEMEPIQFEEQWKQVLVDFDLMDHIWLNEMFKLREFWIPAYFRDVPMSGMFRTTSMSESENHFFRIFLNPNSNLMMFYLNYWSALDSQRLSSDKMNYVDESFFPDLRTNLSLERSAASLYSNFVFQEIQEEWVAAVFVFRIESMADVGNLKRFFINDKVKCVFKVEFNVSDVNFYCNYKKLVTDGIICRHILLVLKHADFDSIPDSCIRIRWGRNVSYRRLKEISSISELDDVGAAIGKKVLDVIFQCVGLIRGNPELMKDMLIDFQKLIDKYQEQADTSSSNRGKDVLFQKFYGSKIPDNVEVLPPDPVRTKGCGSRLKSRKEKALRDANKPKRMCRNCNQLGHHDSRNCPKLNDSADSS